MKSQLTKQPTQNVKKSGLSIFKSVMSIASEKKKTFQFGDKSKEGSLQTLYYMLTNYHGIEKHAKAQSFNPLDKYSATYLDYYNTRHLRPELIYYLTIISIRELHDFYVDFYATFDKNKNFILEAGEFQQLMQCALNKCVGPKKFKIFTDICLLEPETYDGKIDSKMINEMCDNFRDSAQQTALDYLLLFPYIMSFFMEYNYHEIKYRLERLNLMRGTEIIKGKEEEIKNIFSLLSILREMGIEYLRDKHKYILTYRDVENVLIKFKNIQKWITFDIIKQVLQQLAKLMNVDQQTGQEQKKKKLVYIVDFLTLKLCIHQNCQYVSIKDKKKKYMPFTVVRSIQRDQSLWSNWEDILKLFMNQLLKVIYLELYKEEMVLEKDQTLTAIATSDCQLLVLEKQYYQQLEKVLFLTFQHQRELIFRVFQKIQGSYSSARIESMIYSFQNCIVKKNEKICVQDEYGQYFYIIDSGELQLSQQNTQNRETIITILSSGAILGEEIVFQNKYSYSAKIISLQAKLLRIHKEDFKIKFPPECRKTISRLIDIHRRDRQELYILANQREENTSPLRIKIKKPMIQQQEQLVIENNDGNCINTNSNNNSNNNNYNNHNNTKSSGSRKYSLLELQSIMRFDQDSSGFRNMIKVRTSSQYLSSTKGFVASNFSNYSSEYLSSQQQSKLLLNPCEPIKEQLDFGKGEVQEMNKRKQIQLCVMGKDQLNYLTSKNSPKLIKLRDSFMKSFKKHNKSSQNSFSISAPVTPMSSHVSPDSSLLRFKYCQ